MPGQRFSVCGDTKTIDANSSFHRIPKNSARRSLWLDVFGLSEEDILSSTHVCSRHFPEGNVKEIPSMPLGKVYRAIVSV